MKIIEAIPILRAFDQQDQYVFTKHDLKKLSRLKSGVNRVFPPDNPHRARQHFFYASHLEVRSVYASRC